MAGLLDREDDEEVRGRRRERAAAQPGVAGYLNRAGQAVGDAYSYFMSMPDRIRQQTYDYAVSQGVDPAIAASAADRVASRAGRTTGAVEFLMPQTAGDVALMAAGPLGRMAPAAGRAALALGGGLLGMEPGEAEAGRGDAVARGARNVVQRAADAVTGARRGGRQAADLPDVANIDQWKGSDFYRYGKEYGLDNLGPKDDAAWRRSLKEYRLSDGRTITVPGGHESTQPFTYFDLAHLQAQGVNPRDLPDEIHRGIHNRMMRSMQPANLEPHQIFNQLAFAQVSPNQPLTPNLFALQGIAAKGPEELSRWADRIPWRYDSPNRPGPDQRRAVSNQIVADLGLGAQERGGLGVSGNADYTNIAELAQMVRDRPDWFRFRGAGEGGKTDAENWSVFVERLMNQVPGLRAKTGSFGAVWQSPETAQISAIDRHMATLFGPEVFSGPAAQRIFTTTAERHAAERGVPVARTPEELMTQPGGRGAFVDAAMQAIGRLPAAQYRNAKTGEINPRVPETLRDWISEPEKVQMLGGAYVRGLEANAARAAQTPGLEPGSTQSTFANQWMNWDRQRQRLDPHLMMFPGLDQLPRMSPEMMQARRSNYGGAGYFNYRDVNNPNDLPPVRSMPTPGSAAYWSLLPGAVGLGGLLGGQEDRY